MDGLRCLLQSVSCQDPSRLANAVQELKSLENLPGFHAALIEIATDRSLDAGARLQAILYLKNGIDRYWRKMAPNAIGEEEKARIRHVLLQGLGGEPVYAVALQAAVVVGKVARFDVPKDWPELLPALVDAVQTQDVIVQHRALLVLHHTIKSLATKRLAADRRLFHDMIEQLLPYLLRIWQHHHGLVVQLTPNAATSEVEVSASLEKAILAMKVLRKALIHGLRKPRDNRDAMEFFVTVLDQIKPFLPFRTLRPRLKDMFEKYIVLYLKIISDLLENHPFSFLPILKQTLTVVCSLCFTQQGEGLLFQRFIIFSFNIVKQVLLCAEYKLPKSVEDITTCPAYEAHCIRQEFFDQSTVTEICTNIIAVYLPLSKEDLELWDADPEQYVCEDGGDSWRYSYRPCCETLFLTVFHEFRDCLAPIVVDMVRNNSTPVPPSDLNGILHKDAIYNAVGLAAFDLYDEIDFDTWLVNGIEHELKMSDSNYRIVRRRATWLIGQWSGVKLSPELRPKLYQLLVPLLQSNEDLVVRLAAAKALKVVIDDFEFSSDELKPYLGAVFDQLFNLLKQVEECDTKLSILNVLAYLIERVGVGIRDLCTELAQYLPSLWAASDDHDMLRCSILYTLVFIVQGLGTISETLAPFLFSVIHMSTDLNNKCSVYLLEDGLELWLVSLHNSKRILPQWLQLTGNIPAILELGSENLRTMLYIVQAYVLLAPVEFIQTCGHQISGPLREQFADLQDEGVILILRLVDLIMKVGPPPQAPYIFKSLLLCSHRAVYEGDNYPMIMTLHLSIISRILLSQPIEFNNFTAEIANELGLSQNEVAGHLLDVWIDKMPCVTQPDRRKLLSLALASLLNSGSPVIHQRVYGVFLNVTETLNDIIRQDDETKVMFDSLLTCNTDINSSDDADDQTEHELRKKHLNNTDLVHTIDLRDYFQSQVKQLHNQLGETKYLEIMNNVDAETMKNMLEFISV